MALMRWMGSLLQMREISDADLLSASQEPINASGGNMKADIYENDPALGIPKEAGIPLAALITFSTVALVIVLVILSRDKKVAGLSFK